MPGSVEAMTMITPTNALLDQHVPARAAFSTILEPGQTLRIIDLESQQAVDALFYNADDHGERYSAQDTLLAQARAGGRYDLTTGAVLLSNEARPMATIIDDTCGFHDTCAGACSCESNTVRFGFETKFMHACRENFLTEIARYGMDKRDLVSNVNFFMNVPIRPDGELTVDDGVSTPGGYVELRAEMRLLVVLSNCPQVNNPCNGFNPTPIRCIVWAA
ncbi:MULTISPECIES: urea amidolyase associated protein UAAP2 [unclassified Acidiphilium]|uniref:urea amidolyase associated protein UAAP2 n=1 Tax=unclassified Acidiphilium TaxID=2617493 RepID=UPI00257F2C27|nr:MULTISPECIES: urea amidolyase associated protein UAAP2 [unclassified Acidiphilium]